MPDAGHVLISHNRRDPRVFDLYRVELDSGKETLIAKNPGDGVAPIAGRKGAIEGWFRPRETRRLAAAQRAQAATPPQAVPLKQPEEHFSVLGAAADRSFVWALSNRGRDRVALVIAHPTLRWEKVVFEDADADVSEVSMSRVTGAPLLATAQPGYPRVTILDASLRADLDGLLRAQGAAPFGVEIVSSDHAERRMIVSVYTSTQRRFYLLDRPKRQFELLAEALPRDLEEVLAPMRPIVIKSRDGLALHGYLTLPRGVAPKALPMVLLVHSGPWERSLWVDPTRAEDSLRAQFLANRGYAVLQVDFRGSKGYGSSFFDAGIGEFAGEMQDDLLDAVHWAVDGGIADPAHVAIMGWSYGGYAALVGMSMTPEVFACGISLAGPTDLASLIESFPPYWKVDLTMWHDFVGDPAVPAEREEMTLKSPLSHAAQVQRPVLIVHGAQDVRVRINQSERMVQALRQAGKPVEYVPIADMGHGMSYWAHRLAILRKTERFLQRCLGGRASRYDPFDTIAWAWTRLSR
jgi:dipeptidyl aminopeptidase/acylaminoacyl peptidase